METDIVTRVELEYSYGAGDGWTRSRVASMPKERSGRPGLDRSCDWKSMDMTVILTTAWTSTAMATLVVMVVAAEIATYLLPTHQMFCYQTPLSLLLQL